MDARGNARVLMRLRSQLSPAKKHCTYSPGKGKEGRPRGRWGKMPRESGRYPNNRLSPNLHWTYGRSAVDRIRT